MTGLRRFWASVKEPRHLKATYWVIYGVTALTGAVLFVSPPEPVVDGLGIPLAPATAALLVAGGVGGLCSVLQGWWWAERLATYLIAAGVGIYGIVSISLFRAGGAAALGMLLLALSPFVLRWLQIRKYSFEPRG